NILSCMGNWDEDTIDAHAPLANNSFKKEALDKPVSSYEAYCIIICQSSEESDEAPSPNRINT
uniref:Uncharacterized protein n=1 Tax=Amphimedon queenslandica TaxID=400682 RepID=A0A1X7TH47_AMPQE